MSAEDAAELERLRSEAAALEDRAEALRATLDETRLRAAGAAAEREQLQAQRAGLLAEREAMRSQVRLVTAALAPSYANSLQAPICNSRGCAGCRLLCPSDFCSPARHV